MSTDAAARPPLDAEALRALVAPVPDLQVEVVAEAGSTNADLAERARSGEVPDGAVLVADHQTGGRGRLDRTWTTPPGTAVTFSMLLRPTVPPASLPWLPLLTGHVVAKELVALGYPAVLKWPNDVMLSQDGADEGNDGTDERKVAGILVELVETPTGPAAIVGVGMNVGMTADELPVPTATSLLAAPVTDGAPDRTALLGRLLLALREGVDAWQAGGAEQGQAAALRLAESYAAACTTVGRDVRVELPVGPVLEGRATGIDTDGRLMVETTGGKVEHVGAGDVVHVR